MRWPWQERDTSDFRQEIEAHLAMEEDRLRAGGFSAEEARYEARRAFGNPTRAAEDFADRSVAEGLNRVGQEFRLALRGLIRQPGFTLPALLTLAIGTGGIAAVFTLAEFALLRPLPYESPERLVRLGEGEPGERAPNVGWQTYDDLRSRVRGFEALAVYRTGAFTLLNGGEPEQLLALQPSSELLPMLGVKPLVGRLFTEAEDRPQGRKVVLLAHGLWLRRFGADPRIVGQVVALNERPYEVIGVLPPGFDVEFVRDGSRHVELILPLGYGPGGDSACRSCRHLRSIARLRVGTTIEGAGRDAAAVYAELKNQYPNDYPRRAELQLRPLREVVYGELSRPVLLLLAASGLVLLIACVNVVNLLLVRVNRRGRELAVMAALGAGRSRLMARSVLEGLLLSIMGSLLGVGLALWAMPALRWLAPPSIAPLLAMRPDGWVLAVVFGLAALAGLITGMAPAWQALKAPGVVSGVRATEGHAPLRARNALVMGQLGLAFALVLAAGGLLLSLSRLLQLDPGFQAAGVTVANVNSVGPRYPRPEDDIRFFENVMAAVRSQPGVTRAGVTDVLPIGGDYDRRSVRRLSDGAVRDAELPDADVYVVGGDYFTTLGVALRSGRLFDDRDRKSTQSVAILNEQAARQLFPQGAIGQQLLVADSESPYSTVVGVVNDVRQYGLDVAPAMQVYLPLSQRSRGFMTIVAQGTGLREAIRRAVKTVDPTRALTGESAMTDVVEASVAHRRFVLSLLLIYGGLALLLALVGIHGVLGYAAAQRTREIGIRLAVGAQAGQILFLLLRQALRIVFVGLALGAATYLAMAPLLRSMLFETGVLDPRLAVPAGVLLGIVALLASLTPALRASRLNPVDVLRE